MTTATFSSFYVASYPRSGNTWLRQVLHQLLGPRVVDANPVFVALNQGGTVAAFKDIDYSALVGEGGNMIKTHGRFGFCQPGLPVVHLVRDARDCLYSYYHFNRDHRGLNEPWSRFF